MIKYKEFSLDIQEKIDHFVKLNLKPYFIEYVLPEIKLNKKKKIKKHLINKYIRRENYNKIEAFNWFENDFERWLNKDIALENGMINRYKKFYENLFNLNFNSFIEITDYCNKFDSEYLINIFFNYLNISEIEELEEFIRFNIYF
jgi:hypothetical protein